jgi:hypothetical protein
MSSSRRRGLMSSSDRIVFSRQFQLGLPAPSVKPTIW